jgi:XTP/dITP diphosphohydrolase
MDRLRRECPWDQRQTHQSLLRYLIEEAHEVIEAVETGDPADLREELGDLLLQVVFHARIARESADESFDIDDVAAGIVDKLVSRHPHVFAGLAVADAEEVERNWTTLKRQEKGRTSPLDGIPAGLPALSLADKVVSRLAAAGRDVSGSLEDVDRPASRGAEDSDVEAQTPEAVGQALFRIAARASLAGIDPEQALRQRVRQEMRLHGR